MTIKVQGKSNTNEFVHCNTCKGTFVWLNCYETSEKGYYYAECRKCRQKRKKLGWGVRDDGKIV